jgi:hypothetical protein
VKIAGSKPVLGLTAQIALVNLGNCFLLTINLFGLDSIVILLPTLLLNILVRGDAALMEREVVTN